MKRQWTYQAMAVLAVVGVVGLMGTTFGSPMALVRDLVTAEAASLVRDVVASGTGLSEFLSSNVVPQFLSEGGGGGY